MRILAKVYVDNNKLCLEHSGELIDGKSYPYGEWGDGHFNIGNLVLGKENVAISKEAIDMYKYIVNNAEHTGDDISCLNIWKIEDGREIGFSWLGPRKIKIDPNNLDEIFIGCGEGRPKLDLLDKLQIQDNEFLKDYKFETKKEEESKQF